MDAREVSREVLKQYTVSIVRFLLDVAFNKFIEWKLADGGAVCTKLYELLCDTNRTAEPQINNSCSLLTEGLILLNVDQNLAAPGRLNVDEALAQHVELPSQRSGRSHDRLASVKYCFERSGDIARKAFFESTVIRERVMACKLRVAAKLLASGHQDSEAACIASCLHYIDELHRLPEIKDMFSFLLKYQGPFKTKFMGNEPLDIALSVLSINHQVFHFAVCRSQVYPFLFNWQQISLNDRKFHPILDVHEVMKKAPESEDSKSLYRTILSLRRSFAVRNPNEIIKLGDENVEVIIKTDKVENISVAFPEGNPVEKQRHALTIDDTTEETYVVRKVKKHDELNKLDFKEIFMLYVFRQNNVIETLAELDFITANDCEYINIALHKRRLNLVALKDNHFYSFDKKGEMVSEGNSEAESNWQTAFDFYHEQQYD